MLINQGFELVNLIFKKLFFRIGSWSLKLESFQDINNSKILWKFWRSFAKALNIQKWVSPKPWISSTYAFRIVLKVLE